MKKRCPKILDIEAITKYLDFIYKLDKFGYGEFEVSNKDILENIHVPEAFWKFCLKYKIKPANAINMIVRDFVTRYWNGNKQYEQGILNRIRSCEIPEKYREIIIKQIFESEK